MKFRKWFSRRKWSTVTEDRISAILSEISPRYNVLFVAFWSDSLDGVVRPDNILTIFVVCDVSTGYFRKPQFTNEVAIAMDRGAYFSVRHISAGKSDPGYSPIKVAYVRSPPADGPDEE